MIWNGTESEKTKEVANFALIIERRENQFCNFVVGKLATYFALTVFGKQWEITKSGSNVQLATTGMENDEDSVPYQNYLYKKTKMYCKAKLCTFRVNIFLYKLN